MHRSNETKVFYINIHPEYCGLGFRDIDVLGSFSLDCGRNFCTDLSQLKYLKVPENLDKVHYDLNHRRKDLIEKNDVDEKLDNLLKWIVNDKRVWKSLGTTQVEECNRTPVDFVCYRGLLTRLMTTPYENFDGWIICASVWKGTIYLCAKETAEQQRKRTERTEDQKKFLVWGRKFEQYLLADTVDGVPNADRPINENEELCVVFSSKINGHKMLYGAEVDGVNSNMEISTYEDLRKANFVELKTHRTIEHRGHNTSFRKHKLRTVWCQAAPVGIDYVLFGHRCDKGIVRYLEKHSLDEILNMSVIWKPGKCFSFLNKFLETVKQRALRDLPENSPESCIKCEWQVGHSQVRADVIIGQSEYSFLPKWFTDNFQHSVQIEKCK